MSLFQKLITETQISNPPEPAMDHNSIKLMILLPFIAIYFRSFRYETPCIMILCCVAVCHLLRSGVAALFGPQSGTTSSHVQSICDAMEIPHIETRWDYRLRRDEYSVNLYPHPSALSKVSPSLQIDSFFCFLNSKEIENNHKGQ